MLQVHGRNRRVFVKRSMLVLCDPETPSDKNDFILMTKHIKTNWTVCAVQLSEECPDLYIGEPTLQMHSTT